MSRCPTGGILPEKCGGGRQERTRCVPGWERLPGMVQWPDLIRAALPSRRHTARPGGAGRFAPAGVFCPTFRCGKNGLFCIGYTAGRKKAPRIHPRIAGEGCGTPFSFFCVFCGSVSSAPPAGFPAGRPERICRRGTPPRPVLRRGTGCPAKGNSPARVVPPAGDQLSALEGAALSTADTNRCCSSPRLRSAAAGCCRRCRLRPRSAGRGRGSCDWGSCCPQRTRPAAARC